nr:non-ribosomal peptide synthetase [uncultured Rhodopila sp.]
MSRPIWCRAGLWLLPLTPNRKSDRVAPPAVLRQSVTSNPASTPIEAEVAAIWRDVLKHDCIPADTGFFRLGGDSILEIGMFVLIEQKFRVSVRPEFQSGDITVAGLAAHIAALLAAGARPVQPPGTLRPFFCVPGIGGDTLHLAALARHLDPRHPLAALRHQAMPEAGRPDHVEAIAARLVAELLEQQPEGPFLLGGYSAGATIAFEMAQQLTALGHAIALLVLIDARRPGWRLRISGLAAISLNFARNLGPWVREDLARSSARQVLRDTQRKLRRLVGAGSSVENVVELSRYPAEMQVAMQNTYDALRLYRAQPWSGRVTLLRARAQPVLRLYEDPSLGWGAVARGGIDLHCVPGNHKTAMEEPHVRSLAAALNSCIARVSEQAARTS